MAMRANAANARAGDARKSDAGPWFLGCVHRDDTDGDLYAPISATNGRKYNVPPTRDRAAMLRFVLGLNEGRGS